MISTFSADTVLAMRRAQLLPICLLTMGLVHSLRAAPENVRVYSAAQCQEISKDFVVAAEGQTVPAFTVLVPPGAEYWSKKPMNDSARADMAHASVASFDMNAPVAVTIICPDAVSSAVILPTSYGVVPKVDGKTVTFTLDRPRLLTVEVNGDALHSLHLFADPFEDHVPKADDPNVIYYGPGVHDLTETLRVGDGKTLYLAGGAVLRGTQQEKGGPVVLLEGHDIKLCGRGVIDGALCPFHTHNLLMVRGQDISVEGITLCDSPTWNMPVRRSDRVTVRNIKVFGWRGNSDGIDICNSRDVTVEDCFLRTFDDLVVVKSDRGQGPAHHVVVKGCVLWSPIAHALSLGAELREDVDDVLFTDCDVIHDTGREWTLRVYHCDNATIKDVRFENIRIEESKRPISVWINKAVWSLGQERGHVQNVFFKDITGKAAEPLKIELQGFDADHLVEGVRFENVQFNGKPLQEKEVKINPYVKDVSFTPLP